MRWTRLKRVTNQAFSEGGKRTFGRPTCIAIGSFIAVGTTKGLILLFDYSQTLKNIVGQGTAAAEGGSITSLAISADHSTVAGGHADGSLFTWEIARPAKPFLHIAPLERSKVSNRSGDGHVSGSAVLHLGFLGTRRTALVSADKSGMAFSHLATRGLGAVARSVKSTRILGRYPQASESLNKSIKPSTVLALQSLPLGNTEQVTDDMGLTALLTPYLLVIVSTTPVARTQYKAAKSADVTAHSAMTGCLAWFPAVKIKNPNATGENVSRTKLVYCWSNHMTVLEIHEESVTNTTDAQQIPNLLFLPVGQWKSDEAVLAVQWLSRTLLAVLTVSQRFIILEESSFRILDSADLNPRHIYHEDLFSRQLSSVVENMDEEDEAMCGVVPDAYHMSIKTYKGRLFLLGMSDISLGTLQNWADRLLSLVRNGNHIEAIALATSYYTGESDRTMINLPDDDLARHTLVKPKLLDMLTASLKYTFKEDGDGDTDRASRSNVTSLVEVAFAACTNLVELDVLFDEVYEYYSDASAQDVFLYTLEPYVIDGRIKTVPPTVLKDLINWYAAHGFDARLEAMICSLDTQTMDVDQVTALCRNFKLFDALIYVWNQALEDFVTPMIELMREADKDQAPTNDYFIAEEIRPALKLFPYLAYTLTGRAYPSGSELSQSVALEAKTSIYGVLFSNDAVKWPLGSAKPTTIGAGSFDQEQYPYLRVLLRYDAPSFMSMLNEAFEDNFLNGGQDQVLVWGRNNDLRRQPAGLAINRQRIMNIMLELMNPPDFEMEDIIYLDIFIARNLPRYPQFLLLPGSTLDVILRELCKYPRDEMASECQLSAEYLLSAYHPTDMQGLIPLLAHAQFYRILKSTYKKNKQYSQWLEVHFEDTEEPQAVFGCINDCLRSSTNLSKKQIQDVKNIIVDHSRDLTSLNIERTVLCLEGHAPDLLHSVYEKLDEGSHTQYLFLKALFEAQPRQQEAKRKLPAYLDADFTEQYVKLMCKHDPNRVADYVRLLESGDLRLNQILPIMESSGVIDAAIVLLARDGLAREAMDRLLDHIATLGTALAGLLGGETESPDVANRLENASELLMEVQKYVKIGIWLCQGQTRNINGLSRPSVQRAKTVIDMTESDLTTTELLWLDLCDAVVKVSRAVPTIVQTSLDPSAPDPAALAMNTVTSLSTAQSDITSTLRTTVQSTFTALLAATTSLPSSAAQEDSTPHRPSTPPSPSIPTKPPRFLPILRLFLARTSSSLPTLSSLRSVLSSIFAAYAFEASLLELAGAFIDKDVFGRVEAADAQRRRGWRPRTRNCGGCGGIVWGPGAGGGVWEAWERRKAEQNERASKSAAGGGRDKGKGRAVLGGHGFAHGHGGHLYGSMGDEEDDAPGRERDKGYESLVVFACGHLFHRSCLHMKLAEKKLETSQVAAGDDDDGRPIDDHVLDHEAEGVGDGDDDGISCPLHGVHSSVALR